jgi:chemotaxis protein methyltransferase CheR
MNAELSDDLYLRFRELLLTRCGLYYPERKRTDLAHGLSLALSATDHQDIAELYADAVAVGPAWETILAQLTIGETYFFRNGSQFDALRERIVPEVLARRAALRTLRLWSAGCATGEEPYSLAMMLSDLLPNDHSWHVSILATDINPVFLTHAREALYGGWSFRETPDALRDRFWTGEQGRWRLQPEIRRMVNFARLNLAEPCYPAITNGTCALDIIVCRNVTIYFDEATTRQVAERFYAALAPGGWLIVGHAEPQASVYHQFEVRNFPNTVVYRKPLDAPLFAFEPARGVFNAPARPILTLPPVASTKPGAGALPQPTATDHSIERVNARPVTQSLPPIPDSPPSAPDLWAAILARLAQGDKAGAEPLLRDLLHADPSHVQALTALGRLYADRGELFSARQQCKIALECDPLCISAHYLLAQIHEHQDQLDTALAAYRRTVYLDRGFIPGTLGMANVWRRMGRAADAQRCYRNALKQLNDLPASTLVPCTEGATAAELAALVTRQLEAVVIS